MKKASMAYKIIVSILVQALLLSSAPVGSFAFNLEECASAKIMLSPHMNVQNLQFQQAFGRSAEFSSSLGTSLFANKWMTVALIGGITAISIMGDSANQAASTAIDSYQSNPEVVSFAMSMLPGYRDYRSNRANNRLKNSLLSKQRINRRRTATRNQSFSWIRKTITAGILMATILVHGVVIRTLDTVFTEKEAPSSIQSVTKIDIDQKQRDEDKIRQAIEEIRQRQKSNVSNSKNRDSSFVRVTPENTKKEKINISESKDQRPLSERDRKIAEELKKTHSPEAVMKTVQRLFNREEIPGIFAEIFEILEPTGFPVSVLPAINLTESSGIDSSINSKKARGPMQVIQDEVNNLNRYIKKHKGSKQVKIIRALVGNDPIDWNKLNDASYGRRVGAASAYLKWYHLMNRFNTKGIVQNEKTGKWEYIYFKKNENAVRITHFSSALAIAFNWRGESAVHKAIKEKGPDPYDWKQYVPYETAKYGVVLWRYFNAIDNYLKDSPQLRAQLKTKSFAGLNDFEVYEFQPNSKNNSKLLGAVGIIVVPFRRRNIKTNANPNLLGQSI